MKASFERPATAAGSSRQLSRRAYLIASGGVALSSGAGCVGRETTPAGSIIVRNRSSDPVRVVVAVAKVSENHDATRRHDEAPDSDPIWRREFPFDVAGGERVAEPGAVDEPGAYYVEASANDASASDWLGLYEARNGVAEDAVYVSIGEGGTPTMSITHGD